MTEGISGTTKICGIIGDPVEHTMSPAMHNAAFAELRLDYIYVAFHVKPDGLADAINGMRSLGITGINVTIPHKIDVMPLLDSIDPVAAEIGAVNTIVNENGVLTGYNTDADGFLSAMKERDISPEGKQVTVLGAGGASRSISLILARNNADVTIMNRVSGMERATALAASIAESTGKTVEALELNATGLKKVLEKTDILVNTTSVGMSPYPENSLIPPELIKPDLVVYDIVYNPIQTRLLQDAAAKGAETISGLNMLVWQGALAFEKWTGKTPPVDLMKHEAMKFLL